MSTQPIALDIRMRLALCLLLMAVIPPPLSMAADSGVIPSQFIAKMYTEALGRAPDQAGWRLNVHYFAENGCDADRLAVVGRQFYVSREFIADYHDNEAKVLALYRGALSRDPDQSELQADVAALNSGAPWVGVVQSTFMSTAFSNKAASMCSSSAPNYGFGNQAPPALTPGAGGFTGTQSALQSVLNAAPPGSTVYLAQKAVINLTSALVVPSGIELTTYERPKTTSYALMARLTRASTFDGPSVVLQEGARLTHVWVDGQRNVLGYHKIAGGAQDNANVVTLGGIDSEVSGNKLSDPQGGTNFFSVGGTPGSPCSNQVVAGNLLTAYSSIHGYVEPSDGLTMNCEGLIIEHNDIVDVSDIGIVLFATPGVTQHSRIANNTIVSAGLAINAPISSDPSTGNTGGSSLDYRGTVFNENTFWTGPYTTFDFGIEAGGREFFRAKDDSNGTGAVYINNTTGRLSARVRAGIAVAGMLDVTITNDDSHPLHFIPVTFAPDTPAASCPGGQVIAEASVGYASGTYPTPTFDGNFDDCIAPKPLPASEMAVTASALVYNATTQTFDGTITLQNVSGSSIAGLFEIGITQLAAGVTLVNASGSVGGIPYLVVPDAAALAPGQSAAVGVRFTDSSNAPVTFDPVVFVGIF